MGKRQVEKQTIEDKVIEQIQKHNMLDENEKIVCAVSGGPDSMVMLDILYNLRKENSLGIKYEIVVAHVNHKIRKESDEELIYLKKYCEKRNIEFFFKEIEIEKYAKENKMGTEEAGRKVRYDFFYEVLSKTRSHKIAIAHNKNDKAETILLNVFRGTGVNGLKGIISKRNEIIRPILNVTREEVEKYAEEKELNPKIDETNSLDIYSRNKVRNKIIPYIKEEFNSNIIETLDRLSRIVEEQEEYINLEVESIYDNIVIKQEKNIKVVIDLKKFNACQKIIKSKLILHCIGLVKGNVMEIENVNIEDVIKMCEKNVGNKYLKPTNGIKIGVENKQIYFVKTLD